MASITTNLALKLWDALSDKFNHTELVQNWQALDAHDHTGAPKGKQIPAGGLEPGAVLTTNIADGAVNTNKIANGAVTNTKLAAGAVTGDKIASGAIGPGNLAPGTNLPIGTVLDWYCAHPESLSTYLPTGFAVCDGTTLAAQDHAMPGVSGSFTLPDLIGAATIGATPSKAVGAAATSGDTHGDAPGVGYRGGSNSLRGYTVPAHGHSKGDLAVASTATTTTGGMNSNTSHFHKATEGLGAGGSILQSAFTAPSYGGLSANSGISATISDDTQSIYRLLNGTSSVNIDHSHNIAGHVHALTGTIGNSAVNGDSNITTTPVDPRSAYVGLLKIMKVR